MVSITGCKRCRKCKNNGVSNNYCYVCHRYQNKDELIKDFETRLESAEDKVMILCFVVGGVIAGILLFFLLS